MSEPLEIEIDATHLYPGATGRLKSALPSPNQDAGCTLIFSDFVRAQGVLQFHAETANRLHVTAYRTAAGTQIPAKTWSVELMAGAAAVLRVKRLTK